MLPQSYVVLGVLAMMGALAGGCAGDQMMGSSDAGAGSASGSGTASASTKNIDRIATGAVEDSLNACLARIPRDASAGQKLLAEESCRRDQAARR